MSNFYRSCDKCGRLMRGYSGYGFRNEHMHLVDGKLICSECLDELEATKGTVGYQARKKASK